VNQTLTMTSLLIQDWIPETARAEVQTPLSIRIESFPDTSLPSGNGNTLDAERKGLATNKKRELVNHQAIGVELPDHNVDAVSAFHAPATVRESHPIGLARLGWGALAQYSDLLHGWHD
jgi:hypothetical protein